MIVRIIKLHSYSTSATPAPPVHQLVQGHATGAGQAQVLLMEAAACGLVALPHAAACLLGSGASPWAAVLVGPACCPLTNPTGAPPLSWDRAGQHHMGVTSALRSLYTRSLSFLFLPIYCA